MRLEDAGEEEGLHARPETIPVTVIYFYLPMNKIFSQMRETIQACLVKDILGFL